MRIRERSVAKPPPANERKPPSFRPEISNSAQTHVQRILLEAVSETTGYPVEMLEPDMTLDSDLGIDSIKRVEIFSVLREKLPDAPEIEAKHLGELETLQDIVDHLSATGEARDQRGEPPSRCCPSRCCPCRGPKGERRDREDASRRQYRKPPDIPLRCLNWT